MDKNVMVAHPIISIIVPVFNVEKYLIRCLNSIFNQKFSKTFEVIAVDDLSVDNSLNILKEYQKNENRLKIIEHNFNKKLSCARSTGIQASMGDYIMHVDSDDYLLPNALENLYKIISESDVDVVVFNYVRENEFGNKILMDNIKSNIRTNNKSDVIGFFVGACWNKIVKRELLQGMIYGNVGINSEEDLIYSSEVLLKSKSIYLTNGVYYSYFINTSSITNTIRPINFLITKYVILNQLEIIFKNYNANDDCKNFFLDYFEKWIYLEFAKLHYWYNSDFREVYGLIDCFKKSTSVSIERSTKLELAMHNKYKSLKEVYKRFGFKMVLLLLFRSFNYGRFNF